MEGSGWSVPGTHSGLTIAQQAQKIVAAQGAVNFVVMAGVNDLGARKTVADMLAGVAQLEAVAASVGTRVLYVGIVPVPQASYVNYRNADRLAFNQALAAQFPGRYLDCSASMSSGDWLIAPYSLAADDLHLSSAGEAALAACIAPTI